jgi:opacity protein-like surface antigen
MWRTFLAISSAFVLMGSVHAAQVYKWVDAQGVTHFSAQPPAGHAADEMKVKPAPSLSGQSAPANSGNGTSDATNSAEQRAIERDVKQDVREQEKKREEFCKSARTNLAQLRNNPRVMVEEGRGQMRRLTEEERQQRISEAEFSINQNCN